MLRDADGALDRNPVKARSLAIESLVDAAKEQEDALEESREGDDDPGRGDGGDGDSRGDSN